MRLDEIILVTENWKGTETNYLSTFEDYMKVLTEVYKDNLQDLSYAIDNLYQTKQERTFSETYAASNKSFYAKFCSGEGELRGFMLGLLDEKKALFDESRCSEECFEVLKAYGMGRDGHGIYNSLHYEPLEYTFRSGEVLHNMNGNDYLVLAVLKEKNLLVMSQTDGQYILAVNAVMYERTPKEGYVSKDSEIRGIEWGHGLYLGHDLTSINLPGIIQEYGNPRELRTTENYRNEARRQFNVYQWLAKEEGLAHAIQWAAEESMRNEFGTTSHSEFEERLQQGSYDSRMKAKHEEIRQQKLR